ncbi:MAG TPA: hypothetical protein VIK07_09330, partial [Bacteroidales bacterium]
KTFSIEDDFAFHRHKDIKKAINQPPRPGNELVTNERITCPGHPSFKKEGKILYSVFTIVLLG